MYKNEGSYENVRMLPSPCLLCLSHDRPVNQGVVVIRNGDSFFQLQQVLAVALGIFSCSLWESSYLTRDQTEAPCFGSVSS